MLTYTVNCGLAIYLYMRPNCLIFLALLFQAFMLPSGIGADVAPAAQDIFAKSNLVAWCIVPFDVKHRNPRERAEMLNRLGISKLAYDWRDQHIPTFDEEIDAMHDHGIKLQAFWLTSGVDPEHEKNVTLVLDFLKRRQIRTQIWYMFIPSREFDGYSQEQKVEVASNAVRYIAEKAARFGSMVGLYNHGGWFGEPENQLAILDHLKLPDIGLVYNFNHAEYRIESFASFFPKIEPHLIALNLAGLDKQHRRVVALGEGDSEAEMIRIVYRSKYRGPIGIINEKTDPDAEVGLVKNIAGLRRILAELPDRAALKTY